MTTIATDGRSMAGDGQRESCGTTITDEAVKVRHLNDGRIFGTAGDVAFGTELEAWLNGVGEKPTGNPPEFAALVINANGDVDMICGNCTPLPVQVPVAIGSGMDFAIGAMDAGLVPEDAVKIASKRDPHTGGTITVLHLEPPLRAVA